MSSQIYELHRVEGEALLKMFNVRVIVLRAGTFIDIQKRMEALLGDEAAALLYEVGIQAGRESAKVLRRELNNQQENFLEKWAKFYQSAGAGWFKIEEINFRRRGASYIKIKQSFIAEEYGKSSKPVCHFLCGFLAGALQVITGKTLTCEEIKCVAKGDPYCKFRLIKI